MDGDVSFTYSIGSTITATVGAGGFRNNGNWTFNNSAGNGLLGGTANISGGTGNYCNNGTINLNGAGATFGQPMVADDGSEGIINLINGTGLNLNGSRSGAGQTINFTGGNNTLNIADGVNLSVLFVAFLKVTD